MELSDLQMAVLVQPMVEAQASGVAFSRNPKTSLGGYKSVAVTAAEGVGQVVDGNGTPMEFAVDRATHEVTSSTWAAGHFGAEEARRVAVLAMSLEEMLEMGPLDLEFATDGDGQLYLLQARSDVACPWKVGSKGTWTLQRPQLFIPDGPMAGMSAEPVLQGLAEGYESLSQEVGLEMQWSFQQVNGFVYRQHSGVSWLQMLRALPRLREMIVKQTWAADVSRWLEMELPRLQQMMEALAAPDVEKMSDAQLLEHVRACQQLLRNGTVAHRRFSTSVLPLLHLLSFCRRHGFGQAERRKLLKVIDAKAQPSLRHKAFSIKSDILRELLVLSRNSSCLECGRTSVLC